MWHVVNTGVEENIFGNIKLNLCQIWRYLLQAIKYDRTRANTISTSVLTFMYTVLKTLLHFSHLWLFILMMIMILCNGDIWRSHPSSIKVQCQFMSIISNIFTLEHILAWSHFARMILHFQSSMQGICWRYFAAKSFRIMNPLQSDYRQVSWTVCANIVTNIDNNTIALWPEKCPTMQCTAITCFANLSQKLNTVQKKIDRVFINGSSFKRQTDRHIGVHVASYKCYIIGTWLWLGLGGFGTLGLGPGLENSRSSFKILKTPNVGPNWNTNIFLNITSF